MQGNRQTKAHSLPGDGRGRDLSGHAWKPTDRGAPTFWRQQRDRLVRTCMETDRPRRTHFLETVEGRSCQDTQGNRPTEAHSLPGDGRGRDLSGHGKKAAKRGALTNCRRQREGLVRTRKETDRQRCTHFLETAERGTYQDTQGNRPTDRGALTTWRQQNEGLVRTRKETNRPRRTHKLETAEGGSCQDTQGNRPIEAHLQTGDSRGRDLSGHARKPTDRGPLTNWRRQREGLVRTCKETDRPRRTHFLNLSGHARKPTDQGALTF